MRAIIAEPGKDYNGSNLGLEKRKRERNPVPFSLNSRKLAARFSAGRRPKLLTANSDRRNVSARIGVTEEIDTRAVDVKIPPSNLAAHPVIALAFQTCNSTDIGGNSCHFVFSLDKNPSLYIRG
jgi:hypothetical protein